MELHVTRLADVVLLRASGRVDHSNADAFALALAPHLECCTADGDPVLLDCADLEYISSAGLRVLMLASKKVTPAGGRLAMANPQPVVHEIFKISRFQHVLPIHSSVVTALAALSPAAVAAYNAG